MKYQTCKKYKRCHCLFCFYFVIKKPTSNEKKNAEDQWFILLLFCNKTKTKKRIMLMKNYGIHKK